MWSSFGMSSQGSLHMRCGLPCQDACLCRQNDQCFIAAAADGHGSPRHFRSGKGAEFACTAACECLEAFANHHPADVLPDQSDILSLKARLVQVWRARTEACTEENPWTAEELAAQKKHLSPEAFEALIQNRSSYIPYGSTLCAVMVTPGYWLALQLGDGDVVMAYEDGSFHWPMPESKVNQGRFTASLCMDDPMQDFRHCMSKEVPAAVMAYTDGVEKAFPAMGGELASYLYGLWSAAYRQKPEEITAAVTSLAQREKPGDDATIVGLFDDGRPVAAPDLSIWQTEVRFDNLRARMMECETAIQYSESRLNTLDETNPENASVIEQIKAVLTRRREQLESLLREYRTADDSHENHAKGEAKNQPGSDLSQNNHHKKEN